MDKLLRKTAINTVNNYLLVKILRKCRESNTGQKCFYNAMRPDYLAFFEIKNVLKLQASHNHVAFMEIGHSACSGFISDVHHILDLPGFLCFLPNCFGSLLRDILFTCVIHFDPCTFIFCINAKYKLFFNSC